MWSGDHGRSGRGSDTGRKRANRRRDADGGSRAERTGERGFTAMLIGIGLAYYTSHRRLWALALPEGNGSKVLLAGRASKNSLAFEEEFNGLCERLKAGLQ